MFNSRKMPKILGLSLRGLKKKLKFKGILLNWCLIIIDQVSGTLEEFEFLNGRLCLYYAS